MVSTNNLKNGMTLLIDGKLQQIVEQCVKLLHGVGMGCQLARHFHSRMIATREHT